MSEPLEFSLTLYPDPVLRRAAEPVASFDEELASIVQGMFSRMRESQGVGLAAPQVGLGMRILVLNHSGEAADDLVLVNPEITDRGGSPTKFDEGCLSFPEIYAEISRPDRCTVEAFDASGKAFKAEYEGFVSRIVQHEYDHLEGVLLVDRMSPADKLRNKADLEELVEKYKAHKASLSRP
jgi:peptide deformylase